MSVQGGSRSFLVQFCTAFQYILCVGSSGGKPKFLGNLPKVSIHPMCRFKLSGFYASGDSLGFNTSYVSVQVMLMLSLCPPISVSIHPMCRFKSIVHSMTSDTTLRFNTSYVSVQGCA